MPPSSPIAWLRRVCLDDYGYNFALPALAIASAVLSEAVIRRISFTEIDFQTYVAQAALFLNGERDYTNIDPPNGSGPCVYPAAHLYVYSFFHWLTSGGSNILPAQHVFAALLTANNLLVALLYRQAGLPPLAVLPLFLSKRIYSIFLLRMFNDPIAILFVYAALLAAIKARWNLSALLFSFGLGIKMNVLLFLPGLAAASFAYAGIKGAVSYVTLIVAVQGLLSLPFTLHDPHAYLSRAFDFSRAFLYVWTVNWRFVPEDTFLSQHFAKALLALHLALLVLFGLFRWTAIGSQGPRWILNNLSNNSRHLVRSQQVAVLCTAFTSNVIGILCSRSLHYQFYSWYFHQVPLLLWFSKLPVILKLLLPVALEWCWNVFPSTHLSSQVLLACHVVLVLGCLTVPGLIAAQQAPLVALYDDDEEDEVDNLLSTDDLLPSRKKAVEADVDSDTASALEQEAENERQQALKRVAEARQAKAAKEAKLQKAFRRRIAVRRRILALLGKLSLLLRPILVLASIALIFVVPHPQSPVSKGTYVDENALQPGQARVYWDYFDVTYADMLSEKVNLWSGATSAERADFVYSELQSYGLEVNRQDYRYDDAGSKGHEAALSGTNVYARSATPRIDGREAVVLTASWRSRWQGENDPFAPADNLTAANIDARGRINVRGIASILALARYLSTQAHLSKDLIFVISDGHLEGIHAWSSAYFGSMPKGLHADPVSAGGSQVWNAISIDYPSDSFSSLEVQYEGFDGQLPNMDVVNTIVRIAESVAGGMPVEFGHKLAKSRLKEPVQRLAERYGVRLRADVEYELGNYENGVCAALRQVGFGVTGRASGPHGFFQRHHVDAITLYAVPATGPYGFFHMGRLIESFVRSMSNLLERLHHSQFFYLLLNPRRFVPIGTAILIPLFLSISLTISGLAQWFAQEKVSKQQCEDVLSSLGQIAGMQGDVQPETPTLSWYRDQLTRKYLALLDGEGGVAAKIDAHADALRESMRPIAATLTCVGSAALVGVGMLSRSDVLFAGLSAPTQAKHLVAVRSAIMLLPAAVAVLIRSRCTVHHARRIGSLLIAFAYLQAGMLVAVLSVLNFALAAFLALAAYAALRIASGRPYPTASSSAARSGFLRGAAVLVFSPIFWATVLHSSLGGMARSEIAKVVAHWKLFNAATVPIVCLAYLPIVLQAQLGAFLRV
ncbi:related to Alpha-1,3-mannosyltransferase [Sporisorium reilianum SRZ2]|uniref:Dol-P-Man:Man(5)GlcNAc(2)-PP-Dol alpha-1,3-mannosyltransferase n=1 Tax=Sporisorium reilianum (strain SRZ2) TaxID=999809 RepID=E6ZW66_SPORE|nr:related to Alpha-1,3-mannosyltransferase [Sporisorium reilianum SRZ2]